MEKKIDISKSYEKYKTLSILPSSSIAEYESVMAEEVMHGAHIQTSVTISFEEAVTGTEKELDIVVAGKQRRILVKIPSGIKNGTPIRYKEKGEVGKYGGRRGDLYVNVYVSSPEHITDSEQSDSIKEEKAQTDAGDFDFNMLDDFSDVFENIFAKEEKFNPNQNISPSLEVTLTFMEAVKGTEKEVQVPDMVSCKKCNGTGMIEVKNTSFFKGKAKGEVKPCPDCGGKGKQKAVRRIKVKIPAGIDEGQKLRLKVAGKMESTNLIYLGVKVEKHPKWQRKGYDIYSTEVLPAHIGAGRVVAIETLDGKHYYAVTKHLKDGSQICLRNKGVPKLNNPSERGDHYVTWRKEK